MLELSLTSKKNSILIEIVLIYQDIIVDSSRLLIAMDVALYDEGQDTIRKAIQAVIESNTLRLEKVTKLLEGIELIEFVTPDTKH
jgi:hypothetical protein